MLKFLKSLSPLSELSLLQLSRKLVTLFALTTGERAQTLHMFEIRNIESFKTHLKINMGFIEAIVTKKSFVRVVYVAV